MNKLASMIDDAQAAGETKEVIEKVYKSNEFDHVPPQTARALDGYTLLRYLAGLREQWRVAR